MANRVKTVQLYLADGARVSGQSFGAPVSVDGEVVFATGMVGYPEAFTDPSFHGQILVLTYPLVGNYGVPKGPWESKRPWIRGLIVQEYTEQYSHADAVESLGKWLKRYSIPAMTGVDTRALTKRLREHGVMLGQMLMEGDSPQSSIADPNERNLVSEVSVKRPIVVGKGKKTIIAVDCGMKENIMRHLAASGFRIKRVPWDYNYLNESWDGLFLSNGPGDPTMATTTIAYLRQALRGVKPIFGICLGSQLMALASGAKTYKLRYGHRSQNQPCQEVGTQRCYLTTQNHGFAVKDSTVPKGWRIWFMNANDNTVEGIRHSSKPFFSVQFHPEAAPGPEDTSFLFQRFFDLVKKQR